MGHGPDPALDEATREIMERHAHAGHEHGRCVTCSARAGEEHKKGCPALSPPSLRVPMTGLAAVAWNAHLDAANLERYQRGALEAEIQRLQKQADDMDAGTEKRRMGVLRAIVDVAWDLTETVPAGLSMGGPIHIEQDEDGTLVAVLTQVKP